LSEHVVERNCFSVKVTADNPTNLLQILFCHRLMTSISRDNVYFFLFFFFGVFMAVSKQPLKQRNDALLRNK